MPAEREVVRVGVLETTRGAWKTMLGIRRAPQAALIRLAGKGRTLGGCTTCTGTWGNGAPTGMPAAITGPLLQAIQGGQSPGVSVSSAAGRGSTPPGTPARRTASGARRAAATAASVFALPELRSSSGCGGVAISRLTLCPLSSPGAGRGRTVFRRAVSGPGRECAWRTESRRGDWSRWAARWTPGRGNPATDERNGTCGDTETSGRRRRASRRTGPPGSASSSPCRLRGPFCDLPIE